jgi:hypothetical protein
MLALQCLRAGLPHTRGHTFENPVSDVGLLQMTDI